MKYEILFSSRFKKSFSKIQDKEKKIFYEKLSLFIENHRHPSLRTKKIKGSEILFELVSICRFVSYGPIKTKI